MANTACSVQQGTDHKLVRVRMSFANFNLSQIWRQINFHSQKKIYIKSKKASSNVENYRKTLHAFSFLKKAKPFQFYRHEGEIIEIWDKQREEEHTVIGSQAHGGWGSA